jgi:[acyl-carrier-protein] S-malonyltransferase
MGLDMGEMAFPVVTNVDATPERQRDNIPDKLYRQISSPVLWEDSIKRMAKEGVEVFLEVGPQKVLTNLARRIEPDIPCYNVEGYDDIEAIMGVIG